MNSEFKLSLLCLMVLLTCTKELPVDISSEFSSTESESNQEVNETATQENSEDSALQKDTFNERFNYSRMLKISTTLGYDEWWYYTTRRPQIFFKDFPGRPGVATWKEISPGTATDNRKSRKMTSPTASGVSSSSYSWKLSLATQSVALFVCYSIAFSQRNFRCM